MFGDQGNASERPSLAQATATGPSKLQSNGAETWKNAYDRLGSRAVLLNELRLQGTIACLLQLVITITLSGIWYTLVYSLDSRLTPVPILTWGITAAIGCLGIAGFVVLQPVLLGLHAVLGLAMAAGLGAFHTEVYLLMADRCDRTQSSFIGCSACACAATNSCTRAALEAAACAPCKAWATDICSATSGFLPYMGLIQLLFVALPTAWSFRVLMRLEKAHADLANRLLYSRAVVTREVERAVAGQALGVDPLVLSQLMATLRRHGGRGDRATVRKCCAVLHMDEEALEVEWLDVEVRGPALRSSIGAPLSVTSSRPHPLPSVVASRKASTIGKAPETGELLDGRNMSVAGPAAPAKPASPGVTPGPPCMESGFEQPGPAPEASEASSTRQKAFLWQKLELNSASESESGPSGGRSSGTAGRKGSASADPVAAAALPARPSLERLEGSGIPGEEDAAVSLTNGATDVDTDADNLPEASGEKKKKKKKGKKKKKKEAVGDGVEGVEGSEQGVTMKPSESRTSVVSLAEGREGEEAGGGGSKLRRRATEPDADGYETEVTEFGDLGGLNEDADGRRAGTPEADGVRRKSHVVPAVLESDPDVMTAAALPGAASNDVPPGLVADSAAQAQLEAGLVRQFKKPRHLRKSRVGPQLV